MPIWEMRTAVRLEQRVLQMRSTKSEPESSDLCRILSETSGDVLAARRSAEAEEGTRRSRKTNPDSREERDGAGGISGRFERSLKWKHPAAHGTTGTTEGEKRTKVGSKGRKVARKKGACGKGQPCFPEHCCCRVLGGSSGQRPGEDHVQPC